MDFAATRSKIRAIIFALTGFVEAFLFLRITLDLIAADPNNILVSLISQITDPLIFPFQGLITLPQTGILEFFNEAAIVAFIVYVLGAIAFTEIITAFVYDNFKDIFQNIVDAVFKFLESFLILRIIFDLFAVGLNLNSPQFVKVVYGTTEWAQGIIFDQPFLSGRINISTLLCLIIVVIIDLLTERFLDSVFLQVSVFTKRVKVSVPTLPKVNLKTLIPKVSGGKSEKVSDSKTQPIQQNIVINVPMPQGIAQPAQSLQPQVIIDNVPVTETSSSPTNSEKSKTLPTLQSQQFREG